MFQDVPRTDFECLGMSLQRRNRGTGSRNVSWFSRKSRPGGITDWYNGVTSGITKNWHQRFRNDCARWAPDFNAEDGMIPSPSQRRLCDHSPVEDGSKAAPGRLVKAGAEAGRTLLEHAPGILRACRGPVPVQSTSGGEVVSPVPCQSWTLSKNGAWEETRTAPDDSARR